MALLGIEILVILIIFGSSFKNIFQDLDINISLIYLDQHLGHENSKLDPEAYESKYKWKHINKTIFFYL
jgi:hypothetical protein